MIYYNFVILPNYSYYYKMTFHCDICFQFFTTIQGFKSHERSNKHLLRILQKTQENFQQNDKIISDETMNEGIINEELINEKIINKFDLPDSSDDDLLSNNSMDTDSFQEEEKVN